MPRSVADLMTHDPLTVAPHDAAPDVREIMRTHKVRHVPVVNEQGALVGIISDRDILRHSSDPGRAHTLDDAEDPLEELTAQHLMTFVVLSVAPETPAHQAGHRMLDARVSCMPVVHDERLVGILTESDFVSALSDEDAALAEE